MASFDNHVSQARRNLLFLQTINEKSDFFDWQVTACFYVAVHLINAHIAKTANLHYKTHEETKNAISPHNLISICRIEEEAYTHYVSLEKLSRRARYLCDDSGRNDQDKAHLTHDKHVAKALKRLDVVIDFFQKKHQIDLPQTKVTCPKVKAELGHLRASSAFTTAVLA